MVTHAAGSPSTVINYVREASTGDACVPIDNRKTVEERSATTGTGTNKGAPLPQRSGHTALVANGGTMWC